MRYAEIFKANGASEWLASEMSLAVSHIDWKPFVTCWVDGEYFADMLETEPTKLVNLCQNCEGYTEIYMTLYRIATKQIDLEGNELWNENEDLEAC